MRNAKYIFSKKKIHEMVEPEVNKPDTYKKLRTNTI